VCERKRDDESRSFSEPVAFCFDVAVMQLDDVSRDRQSESEAAAFCVSFGLAESLEDAHGRTHEMVGVLPGHVTMRPLRMSLGYVDVTLTLPKLRATIAPSRTIARGPIRWTPRMPTSG